MPISVSFRGLTQDDVGDAKPLNSSEVMMQFLCTTNDETGAHDPSGSPAPRVRPCHAALHGTVWRIDDHRAPVPPLDYGCRCALRYVSIEKPKTRNALPVVEKEVEDNAADPIRRWLDDNVEKWREVAKAAGKDRNLPAAVRACRRLGIARPSEIAQMVLQAMVKLKDPTSEMAGAA